MEKFHQTELIVTIIQFVAVSLRLRLLRLLLLLQCSLQSKAVEKAVVWCNFLLYNRCARPCVRLIEWICIYVE